jgi:uncharacterized membrane protein
LLSWRSSPGSTIEIAGKVEFRKAPGDRGTELRNMIFLDRDGVITLMMQLAVSFITEMLISQRKKLKMPEPTATIPLPSF